jgi:hypothetical protein
MANNNIGRRISYRRGSNGEKPENDTPGFDPFYGSEGENLIIFPRDRIVPWYEDDKKVKRPVPPQPYGADTFGWQEYENYLDKIGPGAIPIPFDKFMDQLDMLPSDQWGRRPRKKEGVMTVVGDTSAWHKKYLRNFGYSREYLDRLNRDDLERLFDDIMVRSTRRGRA